MWLGRRSPLRLDTVIGSGIGTQNRPITIC
jgi:hypothetical protein